MFSQLTYSVLESAGGDVPASQLFTVDATSGDLFTIRRLDRETLCPYVLECQLDFKVRYSLIKDAVHFLSITIAFTIFILPSLNTNTTLSSLLSSLIDHICNHSHHKYHQNHLKPHHYYHRDHHQYQHYHNHYHHYK